METTDEFRLRWNNCKSNDWKNAQNQVCLQEHLFEHFKSEGHGGFLKNVSIIHIDKTDRKDPKRRENYWMKTLTTYAPFGLNIEDSVWPIPFSSINVTGGLTFLVFVGILVRLGLDLEHNFSVFLVFFILFISLLLISYFV